MKSTLGLRCALCIIVLGFALNSFAGTISSCGTTITTAGKYTVTADLLNCTGDAITVNVSNVTILLSNHTISGPGNSSSANGIVVSAGPTTILGPGTISNFQYGISVSNPTGAVRVIGTTLNANSFGLYTFTAVPLDLVSNKVTATVNSGFDVDNASVATVVGNDISGGAYGILFFPVTGTTIQGNHISGNGTGMWIAPTSAASGGMVSNNIIDNNSYWGIFIGLGATSTFTANEATGNGFYDFYDNNCTSKWLNNAFVVSNSCVQ